MIMMITIRPGPNMDANPAGPVQPNFSIILFSRHLRFLGEEIYCASISRSSSNVPRIFFLSLSRCFALHFDFNNTPFSTAPRYLA